MSDTPKPVFRRATPPVAKAAIPLGQSNTAAHGAGGTLRLNKRMAELGLASRREADESTRQYAYFSTGNFNESTSQLYTDHGLFTADERLTREADDINAAYASCRADAYSVRAAGR